MVKTISTLLVLTAIGVVVSFLDQVDGWGGMLLAMIYGGSAALTTTAIARYYEWPPFGDNDGSYKDDEWYGF